MGKIVAIGGGSLRLCETIELDKLIVRMTACAAPRLLFLPTASEDDPAYIEQVKEVYGELGCQTDTLCLHSQAETDDDVRRKIEWADAFYVGGGDTVSMMQTWRKRGVDARLKDAYHRGAVMGGLSAGAICWFEFGHSDSACQTGLWDFARAYGLGLIPAACCPHYNEEGHEGFDHMMEGLSLPGIALENHTAFIEEDGVYRVVKAEPSAGAYLLTTQRGELIKRPIAEGEIVTLT